MKMHKKRRLHLLRPLMGSCGLEGVWVRGWVVGWLGFAEIFQRAVEVALRGLSEGCRGAL